MQKYLIFLVALFVSVTSALPHIYGIYKYGHNYTPFNLYPENQYQRDELYAYASQVQQVLNGHLSGDAYIWENRNKPSPFLSEFLSVLPLTILDILTGSITMAFIVADFLFPPLLFLIIFYFLKRNFHYLTSLAAASAVIFVPLFSTLLPFFAKGGYLWTGTINDPLLISRTPHPQISLLFLFLIIFSAASALESKKVNRLIPLAILAALSLYSSVFISSTVIVGLIFLSPMLLRKTNKKEIIFSTIVFLIISAPWIINFISYNDFLRHTDFFLRASYQSDILFPRQIRYIFFAIVLFFFSKSSLSKTFIAFALSAGILMDLHQLLLGRSVDADHWISRVIAPLGTLVVFLAIGQTIKKAKNFKVASSFIFAAILFLGFFFPVSWVSKNRNLLKPDLNKSEIFKKINEQTGKDDVIVATTLDLNQFIPGATGRYIYIGPPERALMDSSEQLKRICDIFKISNEKRLNSKPDELLDQEIYFEKWKLDKEINKNTFLSNCFSSSQSYYKIDYLIDRKPDGTFELIKY